VTDLKEILFGQQEIKIASSRSINDCLSSIQTLHRPGRAYQKVDTIVSLSQANSKQYTLEVSKRRSFFANTTVIGVFGVMTSVSFTGNLEADAVGKALLRGRVEFREWYYIGIAVAFFAIVIALLVYPAYSLFSIIFLVFIVGLANWFVRSDKDNLLRELEYAVS
jgi:hypothetical protein